MFLRRTALSMAALLVAAPAFAQMSAEAKVDVLREMDRVLVEEAFVPGVDLGQWRTFLRTKSDRLNATESPREFAGVVNSGLKEFGVSHISLSVSDMRRRGWSPPRGYGFQSPQQPTMFRTRGTQLRWIDDRTALVRVSDFDRGYSRSQAESVFEEVQDARRLVLDLRSNPGGEVENMRHFLGLVIPSNRPIGTFVNKRLAQRFVASGRGDGKDPVKIANWADRRFTPRASELEPFRGQVAVLVDERSASAAEIIANALRETYRSPIVGAPTAGAVLMSTFERLPHGFRIQFPVSDYVSSGGKRLEGNPIRPDVLLARDEVRTDYAIDTALSRLR